MRELVCASANADKVAEIQSILAGVVTLLPRPSSVPDVVEDADSLVGNARLKAVAICAATGQAAVADDTGLFIHALDMRPGVDTAYFAGPQATYADNRRKTLECLEGRHGDERRADFRTVALVRFPDGRELVAEGVCAGIIAEMERGPRGWGYDPLFIPLEGDGRTFAEMSEDEKHRVGHRGRAFAALLELLTSSPEPPM